jgi:IclR family transcriptional regulator, acetate operon repressor
MENGSRAVAKRRRQAPAQTARNRTGHVQSLARAMSILNALSREETGLPLTEMAQTVGLAPSTAHRLLTTLQQERYVYFDAERSVWLIGVQAFIVGNAFARSRDITQVARPFMRRLVDESGETVNLAVEDQGQAIYLAQIECKEMMRAFAKPGARVPLHCSGVGKALLAALPDAEVTKILQKHGMGRITDKTLDTPARLRAALEETRIRRYAFDDEEHAVGLRCVASVVFNEVGEPLAAISLNGPMARITDDRIPTLGAAVMQIAGEITSEMGGRPPA